MPVKHTYLDASEEPAQFAADQCGRQAVAVAEIFADERLVDLPMWTFNVEDDDCGLDPWRTVGGLDQYVAGRAPNPERPFIVENSSGTRSKDVAGDYVVFMQKCDLIKLGIAIPVSRYEETMVKYRTPAVQS